jgi:hypothetical protein
MLGVQVSLSAQVITKKKGDEMKGQYLAYQEGTRLDDVMFALIEQMEVFVRDNNLEETAKVTSMQTAMACNASNHVVHFAVTAIVEYKEPED